MREPQKENLQQLEPQLIFSWHALGDSCHGCVIWRHQMLCAGALRVPPPCSSPSLCTHLCSASSSFISATCNAWHGHNQPKIPAKSSEAWCLGRDAVCLPSVQLNSICQGCRWFGGARPSHHHPDISQILHCESWLGLPLVSICLAV